MGTNGTTGGATDIAEGCSKMERKVKEKEQWSGEEMAKKMIASGIFDSATIATAYKELSNEKPSPSLCKTFSSNQTKARAPEFPIPDDKLIKLTNAPENFVCAAKISVPEFSRTMILSQVPEVSEKQNIEDFWRMIFQNTVFMSMNGIGRAGTMLALFTSMLHVSKGKEVNTKEIMTKLRSERCGIVDSAEQYGTVYRAMALWFKNKSQDEEIQKKVNEFAPSVK
uniref:Tyrosine-protein phosphatase domain-containing protein n=1 Tax=Caenorhabditis tropicalis TaxID=1561998 RepID=A0A1I7T3D4_9PELO